MHFREQSRERLAVQCRIEVEVESEVECRIQFRTRCGTQVEMPLMMRLPVLSDERCEVLLPIQLHLRHESPICISDKAVRGMYQTSADGGCCRTSAST